MRSVKANVGLFETSSNKQGLQRLQAVVFACLFSSSAIFFACLLDPKHGRGFGDLGETRKDCWKTGRYTLDTDLIIIVDDGTIHVHSIVLMLAKPVFLQMLTSGMSEASQRRINLMMGNLKDQFKVFWDAVKPVAYAGALLRS